MKVQMSMNGGRRKELARVVGELLEASPVYQGAPSYAYAIGEVILDREAALAFPPEMEAEVIRQVLKGLREQGFLPTESPDQLVIQMPRDGFDVVSLDNLTKLIASKERLIKKALGVDSLAIRLADQTVEFPWFALDTPSDDITAYTHFIAALCDMAKRQKRVTATERPTENEKYAFRCFLLRLGFIGNQYSDVRRILLRNLTGNGSFKSGGPKSEASVSSEAGSNEQESEEAEPSGEVAKPKFSFRDMFHSLLSMR